MKAFTHQWIVVSAQVSKVPFWVWLAAFVTAGCALEYCWMVGFDRLNKRLSRKQKAFTGALLLCIATAAFYYGVLRAYHPGR
jgi:hypothetical protein